MWVTNGKTWYSEDEVTQLKAENEKLKEKYLALLRDNAINTELKLINDNLKAENERLKQALKKIEEIAYTTDFDIVDIQEIVNEVLDANNI